MDRLSRLDAVTRDALGLSVRGTRALHGGSLSEVLLLKLSDGSSAVAKTGTRVATEAEMLRAIAKADAPAPKVLGLGEDVLLLEALPETGATTAGWQALGDGLRALHARSGPGYGWPQDYAFGSVTIENGSAPDWPCFWAERRLLPFVDSLPSGLARRIEALAARLDQILPHAPLPCLLHGDLWTGNVLFGPNGSAHLIDPACYFGDPEVDLAMLSLFGRPPPAFDRRYGPLQPGAADRRAAYQLWPALVHLRLFGSSYRGMVEDRLSVLGV